MRINRSNTLRNRATKGFTMMEMLIAVAILVILMAVSFIGVINYQRTLKQHELDGIARELFITAQNHLTMAQGQGLLKDAMKSNNNSVVGEKFDEDGANSPIRYWFVGGDKSLLDESKKNTLREMLPFGSIDDTVRLGGSYVIKYNLQSAQVLSVFYSDLQPEGLSKHAFVVGDYTTLFINPGLEDNEKEKIDNKSNRLHAFDDDQVIGWYGGDDLNNRVMATLVAPKLKIKNAERLEVIATFDLSSRNANFNDKVVGVQLKVFVRGDTSKKTAVVGTFSMSELQQVSSNEFTATCVLDDITTKDGQFAKRKKTQDLIPGENISVYAEVSSSDILASIAKSATKHTNSLFADMRSEKKEDGTTGDLVGTISNIRHLENMDANISGYDLTKLGEDGTTKFKQVSDLRWASNGSKKPVAFTSAIADATGESADTVRVYPLNGSPTTAGTFAPVTPQMVGATGSLESYVLDYHGNDKKISNVKIDVASGDAGIFATLPSGSSVTSLELVDCAVKTANGNAGTLLGAATGELTLTDVLAHDSTGNVKSKVEGTVAVGGLAGNLVGSVDTGITIDGCAAAMLVESNDAGSAAGGLVGYAYNKVSIANSYAGGHTKDGVYDSAAYNVVAKGIGSTVAGGLVGYATTYATDNGVTIEHCYATTSVSSVVSTGGLVGTAYKTQINNCYATGLIGEGTTKGAFIGQLNGGSIQNCKYYESVNYDATKHKHLPAVGGDVTITEAQIVALDKDLDSYNEFLSQKSRKRTDDGTTTRLDASVPYDARLTALYGESYPLQTVAMLNDNATGKWATTHYGDWPIAETLVVNTKSQT